jgi:membrane protease YdiL (CAAX protease family)
MLASAAIFTAIHPPIGAPAIYCLALAAAWVFQRQSLLIAPIAAHAVYNAIVILAPAARPGWFS